MKENDNQAKHYSEGKLPLHFISRSGEAGLARVLEYGNKKYPDEEDGTWNWYRGMNWTELIASARRHLAAFAAGEDFDDESGLPHIDHVQACAHFLSTYFHEDRGRDNRCRQTPAIPQHAPPHPLYERMAAAVKDPEPEPEPLRWEKTFHGMTGVEWRCELGLLRFSPVVQLWVFNPIPFMGEAISTGCFPIEDAKRWVEENRDELR